jgi:hypothetical protein
LPTKKEPQIQTLKNEFVNYWKEAKSLSPKDLHSHKTIFKKYFFNKENKQFMLDTAFVSTGEMTESELDRKLVNALRVYVPLFHSSYEEIINVFNSFNKKISTQLKEFSNKVPDFKHEGLPIYGIISLGRTLGGHREHKGKPILTIGIDQLVKAGNVDLSILFSHEAFHAYHKQVNPMSEETQKADKRLLLTSAYREGIATYASGYLNPSKSDLKYISTSLREFCTSKEWKKHITSFLKDSKKFTLKDYLKDNTLYSKWFQIGRNRKYPFPEQTGYCIGERVINELSKKYSLQTITKWNLKKVQYEMYQVLKNI